MPASTDLLKRGALVVLEGVDCSGKTTQCKMLKDTLTKKGHSVDLLRFPGDLLLSKLFVFCYVSRRPMCDVHYITINISSFLCCHISDVTFSCSLFSQLATITVIIIYMHISI